MLPIRSIYGNEKGTVLVVALSFMVVLGVLGTTAVLITTTDMKIGANFKASEQAFYEAEAGLEEARARMRGGASSPITVFNNPNWRAYIGDPAAAQERGYDPGNTLHSFDTSLCQDIPGLPRLDYVVQIAHRTDAAGNIWFWGDTDGDGVPQRNITSTGERIYLATCWASELGSNDIAQLEMVGLPPIVVPGPLYVEAPTTVQGNSTWLIGEDQCGGNDTPGLLTTLDPSSVTIVGTPNVTGVNSPTGTPPDIVGYADDMNVESMFLLYASGGADFEYNVDSETHTGSETPGPGDGWGTPVQGFTLQDPSACTESNIVLYNTNDTYIRFSGGVQGCGVLLVDGDLELHGNFFWYGVIISTGSVTFTGGGNKNITGGVIAGDSVDADLVGGNANIVYCSSAINNLLRNRAFRRLSWIGM